MTKKIKISEAAVDFNVSAQEIIDFFATKDNKKRNASSPLNEAEMNLLLEHYTKKHEVKSFDSYYQSRNDERPNRRDRRNSGRKRENNNNNNNNNKKSEQSKKSDRKPEAPKKSEPVKTPEKPEVKTYEVTVSKK